jgi:hypothetical protein
MPRRVQVDPAAHGAVHHAVLVTHIHFSKSVSSKTKKRART